MIIDLNRFRVLTCIPMPQLTRKLPLPKLGWADQGQVWALMCRKDKMYPRCPNYLSKHPSLQARMRAILLDWLTEVTDHLSFIKSSMGSLFFGSLSLNNHLMFLRVLDFLIRIKANLLIYLHYHHFRYLTVLG